MGMESRFSCQDGFLLHSVFFCKNMNFAVLETESLLTITGVSSQIAKTSLEQRLRAMLCALCSPCYGVLLETFSSRLVKSLLTLVLSSEHGELLYRKQFQFGASAVLQGPGFSLSRSQIRTDTTNANGATGQRSWSQQEENSAYVLYHMHL